MSTLAHRADVLAVDVACTEDALTVTLNDGRVVSAPLVWFPRLINATARERSSWEWIGGGIGIHWEALDEDISVASLLQPESYMQLPRQTSKSSKRAAREGHLTKPRKAVGK
ncbi:MAG TPA: DUF2442 domain-containing protein [Phycisphaerae bacterium]|nr:DUF2442 domain-containing protein [Phycisphaerae bacterium]